MDVERDEDNKRNDKYDDSHPTEIYLSPDGWLASEVTDTLRLNIAVDLWLSQLHSEYVDAREGGEQGDESGSTNKTVGRSWHWEWSGDGAVPVQGDGCQHVVGGGQGEGLQEL